MDPNTTSTPEGLLTSHDHLLESLEEWSAIVSGTVVEAGFCDPIKAAPELGMDEQEQAFNRLFCAIAADLPTGTEKAFTVGDCREKAQELDIWETLVAGAKDELKTFGARLKKFRGRQWVDEQGRRFQFGRCETSRGSVYTVRVFATN
jgi:hypothetical protein